MAKRNLAKTSHDPLTIIRRRYQRKVRELRVLMTAAVCNICRHMVHGNRIVQEDSFRYRKIHYKKSSNVLELNTPEFEPIMSEVVQKWYDTPEFMRQMAYPGSITIPPAPHYNSSIPIQYFGGVVLELNRDGDLIAYLTVFTEYSKLSNKLGKLGKPSSGVRITTGLQQTVGKISLPLWGPKSEIGAYVEKNVRTIGTLKSFLGQLLKVFSCGDFPLPPFKKFSRGP